MGLAYSFTFPMPPSVNHYWGTAGKRRFLTAEAKAFRDVVCMEVKRIRCRTMQGRLSVMAWLCPPDRRRRDLDNFAGKALLDALQHAGLFEDDSQIDHLEARRGAVCDGGRIDVIVAELENP